MNTDQSTYGAIVIGGGIAGLTTAAYLGRAGYRTLVLERSAKLGGRAVTRAKDGFLFNVGPHALYQKGEGCRVLADLGVTYTGGQPFGPNRWILDGGWQTLVAGLASCATRHGVQIETSTAVTGIDPDGSGAVIHTGDGRAFEARPGPSVPELANVFVTGDWVGPEGMLVDASFASARLAAELANHRLESASLATA